MIETKPLQVPPGVGDLEQATERLNATIARAEALFAARFVVRGSVPMGDGRALSFGKADKDWRFTVVCPRTGPAFLSTTSRETRTKALLLFEPLFFELEEVSAVNVRDIIFSCDTANSFFEKVFS